MMFAFRGDWSAANKLLPGERDNGKRDSARYSGNVAIYWPTSWVAAADTTGRAHPLTIRVRLIAREQSIARTSFGCPSGRRRQPHYFCRATTVRLSGHVSSKGTVHHELQEPNNKRKRPFARFVSSTGGSLWITVRALQNLL